MTMGIIKNLILIVTGFSSGVVISGGVFAFIAIIGIVPRMAYKTHTRDYVKLYETAIILGGILGSTDLYMKYFIPLGDIGAVFTGTAVGIFVGALAMSLAEVLDVIPVLMKRGRFTKGLSLFILVTALGKLTGALIYFILPNFY